METFHLEQRGELGILHLHAGSANALNARVIGAIAEGLQQASAAQLKGLVLTGYERFFSAGLDLISVYEYDRAQMARFLAEFDAAFQRFFAYPKPIIAALNGAATAGGCILALACDYRVMAESAIIGVNEIQLGLPLPASALEIARHEIPPQQHAYVFYSGKSFGAEEALRVGLVHEVVPPAQLLEAALTRLRAFTAHPGAAGGMLKTMLRGPALERMRSGAKSTGEIFLDAWFSPAARATIGAMREKLLARKR
ncbi:MAG: enoyl-CoA hydratase/isomerase family protein [candidate division KSB1 bacterium]